MKIVPFQTHFKCFGSLGFAFKMEFCSVMASLGDVKTGVVAASLLEESVFNELADVDGFSSNSLSDNLTTFCKNLLVDSCSTRTRIGCVRLIDSGETLSFLDCLVGDLFFNILESVLIFDLFSAILLVHILQLLE